MSLARLLTLFIGLGIVLGLMIWLVYSLYQLYIQISFTAPLLATLLLLLLIALLGALLLAFVYYVLLFQRSNQRRQQRQRSQPKAPAQKPEAAEETLRAVRRQVTQVQDEVARQALLERSRELEHNWSRRDLKVVVFGTGSAGKTSLVNALMGRIVGEVGAPMGTTEAGITYQLQLPGLQRELLITDTPGILEAGVAGTSREQLARQLATEADLLLFVVEDDLRQSEQAPLTALAEIGKRSLLILNKLDRYPPEDREVILSQLRQRVQGLIAPEDVVAIAARPQPLQLASGETVTPKPTLMPLIRRMVEVLRTEGEDLVADNILLQAQRLGEEARQLIDAQRQLQADQVVLRFQWIGAGVIWVTPLPLVDFLAVAAVNAQMVVEIGKVYGCELSLAQGRELAVSLAKTLASLGIVKGAMQLIATALQVSVAGFLASRAIQSVSAAYLTRIAGKSFIEYFRHDQDWGDGGMAEVVQQQFQLNRRDEFIKTFIQEALTKLPEGVGRAIRPLTSLPQPLVEEEEKDSI